MLIPLNQLMKRHGFTPKGVLHIGANTAQEAGRYAAAGITKMIFIEALPDVYEEMLVNISKFPNAVGVNACVSDVDFEKVTFNVADNQGQSSSFLNFSKHAEMHPTVKFIDKIEMFTNRIDSLGLDMTGINYLVSDLQGCDLRAIKGMGDLIDQIDAVYVEVNKGEVYEGNDTIEQVDEYLGSKGFERVETLWAVEKDGVAWGDCLLIRKK